MWEIDMDTSKLRFVARTTPNSDPRPDTPSSELTGRPFFLNFQKQHVTPPKCINMAFSGSWTYLNSSLVKS